MRPLRAGGWVHQLSPVFAEGGEPVPDQAESHPDLRDRKSRTPNSGLQYSSGIESRVQNPKAGLLFPLRGVGTEFYVGFHAP